MKPRQLVIAGICTVLVATSLAAVEPAPAPTSATMPDAVRAAIAASLADDVHGSVTRSQVDGSRPSGVLGIPGAPRPNLLVGFLWAVWVGWIFSTIGAFGGIMAGVGHLTIFGLDDYAKSFGKGHPLNTLITDAIRVSNQWLVGLSAMISSGNYLRMGQLVMPLALSLGIGSVAGSFLIPQLTAGRVNLKDYIGVFGLCVLGLGAYLFWQTTPRGQASKKAAKQAAAAFQAQRSAPGGQPQQGVRVVEGALTPMLIALVLVLLGAGWGSLGGDRFTGSSWLAYGLVACGLLIPFVAPGRVIRFTFYGVEFSFKTWVPAVGGACIAALASFLGVGGGFLLVPFLTTVAGLPMFLVAGTSALAVLIGMIVSTFTYMVGAGVVVPWALVGVEMLGIFVGSMVGPRTQRYIPDIWLQRLFVVLAVYVGLRYTSQGFLGYSILPPF